MIEVTQDMGPRLEDYPLLQKYDDVLSLRRETDFLIFLVPGEPFYPKHPTK